MSGRRNLAADVGGWSVRHRAIAIVAWLVFVTIAMTIGAVVGQRAMTADEYAAGDSAQAARILDNAGIKSAAHEMLLVNSATNIVTAPSVRASVADLIGRVRATGLTSELVDPYQAGLISAGKHSVLVELSMTGDPMTSGDRVQPIVDAVAATAKAHPDVRIDEFGNGTANQWFNNTIGKDFTRAEWTALPVALGILIVAFGAFLAAVLPVGLALTSFLAANGLLALISHRMHVDSSTSSVMLLVGLAVGIDYCMFYLRREREERARGTDAKTALQIAAATSGRSVLISGLTVVVAMSGMFLSGMPLFEGFAVAAILVVMVAVVGSVTVLPALLSLLGDHVDFGRVPGLGGMRRPRGGSKIWGVILERVLRRPGLSVLAAAAFLFVLAVPAIGIHTEQLSLDKLLPQNANIMQSYHRITAAFPGGPNPATVVVQYPDAERGAVTAVVADFKSRALATQLVHGPIQTTVHPSTNVIEISVPLAGNGTDATSIKALNALRHDILPQTFGQLVNTPAYVTGDLALSQDFNAQLESSILPVVVFVLVLAFILMLIAFRSVAIAAISILLNVLSMSAAFGVMVAIFQHGWGAGLFGSYGVGAIESWIPLFSFVILFGLSMDYQVFIVSRIKEAHDRGLSTRDAVAHGVRISAGVVTSAAAIMVAVFAVFATLSMTTFKQLGVGLAVAIFLDATVVRAVLLPSLLCLMGERCWWLPRWLSFLPARDETDVGGPETPREKPTVGVAGAPTSAA